MRLVCVWHGTHRLHTHNNTHTTTPRKKDSELVTSLRFICRGLLCFLRDMVALPPLVRSPLGQTDGAAETRSDSSLLLLLLLSPHLLGYCFDAALRSATGEIRMTRLHFDSSATTANVSVCVYLWLSPLTCHCPPSPLLLLLLLLKRAFTSLFSPFYPDIVIPWLGAPPLHPLPSLLASTVDCLHRYQHS